MAEPKPNPLPPTPLAPLTLADVQDSGLPHPEIGTETTSLQGLDQQ